MDGCSVNEPSVTNKLKAKAVSVPLLCKVFKKISSSELFSLCLTLRLSFFRLHLLTMHVSESGSFLCQVLYEVRTGVFTLKCKYYKDQKLKNTFSQKSQMVTFVVLANILEPFCKICGHWLHLAI